MPLTPEEKRHRKAQERKREFSKEWSRIIHEDVQLRCTDEETEYLTRPQDAIRIQTAISSVHKGPVRTFVDAFACIGGDSLGAMYAHPNAEIHSVQRTISMEEQGRFERLGYNLRRFRNALGRPGKTFWHGIDIGTFLRTDSASCRISVLFLDPPWALGKNPREISPMDQIRNFLHNNVFRFLRCRPEVICLKLPHEADDIEEWPGTGYALALHESLRPRGGLHLYALKDTTS